MRERARNVPGAAVQTGGILTTDSDVLHGRAGERLEHGPAGVHHSLRGERAKGSTTPGNAEVSMGNAARAVDPGEQALHCELAGECASARALNVGRVSTGGGAVVEGDEVGVDVVCDGVEVVEVEGVLSRPQAEEHRVKF